MTDSRRSRLAACGLLLGVLGSPGLAYGSSPFFTLAPFLIVELTSDELETLAAESCRVGESESDEDDEGGRWADQPQEITVACLRAWLASRPRLEERIRFVAKPTTSAAPYMRPALGSVEDQRIRTWCTHAWATDASRRATCVAQQLGAHETLSIRLPGVPFRTTMRIRAQCEKSWPEDYVARVTCEQEQTEAYKRRPR